MSPPSCRSATAFPLEGSSTAKGFRLSVRRVVSPAFVVRVVHYGEADAIVSLFTEELGKVSAIARGARKSTRRFAAALEPMHTIRVTLDESAGVELLGLREAVMTQPRSHILADLDRMNAAGQALRWVRAGSPQRTSEPEVWAELVSLLDRLNDADDELPPKTHLAGSGLRLLRHFGYGLELEACARCGKVCSDTRPAYVDAGAGGLVCQTCGGGHNPLHHLLDPATRRRLSAAASGRDAALRLQDTSIAQRLVDEALAGHAGVIE